MTTYEEAFKNKYKPGTLWITRNPIVCKDRQGNDRWIPFGAAVMVVDYKFSEFEEVLFVLYVDEVLLVEGLDIGLCFNMNPR